MKELQEIIENIHTYQSKAKRTLKEMNYFCGKRDNEQNPKKTLRHHLEGALHEIERYTDKLGEICDYIAGKYLRRLCRIMKRIEACHCNGFVPMDVIMESIDFVNRLVELLNNKSARVGEFSDVSTIDQLFGEKCCTNFNKEANEDPECSDDNENILRQLVLEQMNPGRIDLRAAGSYSKTNEKYINRLINEHKTVTGMIELLEQKMNRANLEIGKSIFNPFSNYEFNEREARSVHFDKVTLTLLPFRGNETNTRNLIEKTKESETYKKIRNNILNSLKTTETSSSYIKNKVPIVCPCTFFKHERSVEKTLTTYIEFFRFGKYMWSYIVLKGIANELIEASFATSGCRSVKDLYFKKRDDHDRCIDKTNKNVNVRYFFINAFFQKYFGDYIHDDELYDNVSPITGVALPGVTIPAAVPVPVPVPVPVSIFTPAKIPIKSFTSLLNNEKFYKEILDLESPRNLPSSNTTIPAIEKASIQPIIIFTNEFSTLLGVIKKTFEQWELDFSAIDDNLKIYNDTNDTYANRNDALNICQTSITDIKEGLLKFKDKTETVSRHELYNTHNKVTGYHRSASKKSKQYSKIYAVWVDECTKHYKKMQEFFNKYYALYDKIITPLKTVSFGTTTPTLKTGLFGFGGIF